MSWWASYIFISHISNFDLTVVTWRLGGRRKSRRQRRRKSLQRRSGRLQWCKTCRKQIPRPTKLCTRLVLESYTKISIEDTVLNPVGLGHYFSIIKDHFCRIVIIKGNYPIDLVTTWHPTAPQTRSQKNKEEKPVLFLLYSISDYLFVCFVLSLFVCLNFFYQSSHVWDALRRCR